MNSMFPEELPRRLIKMFSFVGDTVLDPFLGSGTTTLAAKNLNRNSIGYEINEDFLPVIKDKFNVEQRSIIRDATVEVIKQDEFKPNIKEEIKKLPYVFMDPIKFDKKVDLKKMRFGSKIDNSHCDREEYYSVKQIISPEILVLNNGLKIRLLGVKEAHAKNGTAISLLTKQDVYQCTSHKKWFSGCRYVYGI
jgi:site-specific DNA-methyltransferase (adenine-specific)